MAVVRPFGLGVQDESLESDIKLGMSAVEQSLLEATKSDTPFITEAAQHLLEAGGKRFRPLVVLLASQFGDPNAPGVVPAGCVVELTHVATLYHDDVMDEADLRRGAPSANARWDNSLAILTGDFLFSRASQIVSGLGPEAVRIQAEAFERLVTGQILETAGAQPGDDPVQHYLEVLGGKTSSLVAAAGHLGALMAGADPWVVEILTQYGERIGLAFQLADDILDITSESSESGKTPGTDLREGVPTLPVLRLREMSPDPAVPGDLRLRELLDTGVESDEDLAEALTLLRAHPALRVAREDTLRYAEEARSLLAPLPECPAKQALERLCDTVALRTM
ncbi:polyprenyl synthetase family protein [Phaeacidiphilus oryzae]|uniref:polyprenyl synthetase family protein n=1 Tax=Phaeacidiphilus oryzae TaxID=348818 RepID=UPI00055C2D8A|nr:polyprenyl synthetase family protein [Phaeacidiphilus oryzae]